ncbi:hypothetical protein ACROYT_G029565 [Oculina patagonica]
MLSEKLKEVRFDTIHGAGDADILIAQPAVSVSATRDSVVIADDTDILNLLCHHGNNSNKKLFFKPEPKRGVRARQGLPGHPSYLFCTRVKPLQTSPVSTRAAGMCNIGLGIKSFHLVTGEGKKTDSTLTPEMTEKTPALETLLRVIRGKCMVDCNIAQSAVTESTDLTVHLPVEGVVEVLVSIHTSSDRSR